MKTQTTTTLYVKSTQAMQTEDNQATAGTQTDNPQPETNKHCVSRVNPYIVSQEENAPNEEPPQWPTRNSRQATTWFWKE